MIRTSHKSAKTLTFSFRILALKAAGALEASAASAGAVSSRPGLIYEITFVLLRARMHTPKFSLQSFAVAHVSCCIAHVQLAYTPCADRKVGADFPHWLARREQVATAQLLAMSLSPDARAYLEAKLQESHEGDKMVFVVQDVLTFLRQHHMPTQVRLPPPYIGAHPCNRDG